MSHTPGEWQRDGLGGITATIDGEKRSIARVYWENGRLAEAAANERLIGSAPDLLAALEDMYSGWLYIRQVHGDLYGVGWDRAQEKAEAALKKARGE